MFRGNRDNKPSYGLIGTIFVAVIGVALYWSMFYSMGYSSGYHEKQAYVESEHHASDTPKQVEGKCGAKASSELRECITEIVKSERESQRSESDLAAQWKAADWVLWAGAIAGAQLIATLVGLYYVKGTLDATLEAVEDTGKATNAMLKQTELVEREQRPWVTIEAAKPVISNRDDGILITVEIGFKNIGKTVAAGFWPHLKCYLTGADFEESVRDNFAEIRKPRGVTDRILMPGETCTLTAYIVVPVKSVPWFGDIGEKRINAVMQAAVFYYVDGAVHYDARLHTERVFRIGTFDADQPFHKYVLIRKAAENPAKHDFVSTVSGPLATAR